MKRFQFKLQPVHDLRQQRSEEDARALGVANSRVQAARAQLTSAVEARLRLAAEYLSLFQGERFDPRSLAMRSGFLAHLAENEVSAAAELAVAERAHEAALRTAVESARAAEATARLRERQQAQHAEAAARSQQQVLDELATLGAARRHRA